MFVLLLLSFILQLQSILAIVTNQSKYSMSFVCYRCNHCKGEYRTLCGYDCHLHHVRSLRSQCNVARNKSLVSYTQRVYLSTGILWEHVPSFLGNVNDNVCAHSNAHWMPHSMALNRNNVFNRVNSNNSECSFNSI